MVKLSHLLRLSVPNNSARSSEHLCLPNNSTSTNKFILPASCFGIMMLHHMSVVLRVELSIPLKYISHGKQTAKIAFTFLKQWIFFKKTLLVNLIVKNLQSHVKENLSYVIKQRLLQNIKHFELFKCLLNNFFSRYKINLYIFFLLSLNLNGTFCLFSGKI